MLFCHPGEEISSWSEALCWSGTRKKTRLLTTHNLLLQSPASHSISTGCSWTPHQHYKLTFHFQKENNIMKKIWLVSIALCFASQAAAACLLAAAPSCTFQNGPKIIFWDFEEDDDDNAKVQKTECVQSCDLRLKSIFSLVRGHWIIGDSGRTVFLLLFLLANPLWQHCSSSSLPPCSTQKITSAAIAAFIMISFLYFLAGYKIGIQL